MNRRASLPGASELFRRTSNPVFGDGAVTPAVPPAQTSAPEAETVEQDATATRSATQQQDAAPEQPAEAPQPDPASEKDTAEQTSARAQRSETSAGSGRGLGKANAGRRGSGRQKHDSKITVYLSGDELLAMEHARLALRASHDLAVDRGRIVREAVAVLLADFDEQGEDSVLVQRLRGGDLDGQEAQN